MQTVYRLGANNLERKVPMALSLFLRFQSSSNNLLTDDYSPRHDPAITFVIDNYFWIYPEHGENLNQSSSEGVQYKISAPGLFIGYFAHRMQVRRR